jgi:hypothetical protein
MITEVEDCEDWGHLNCSGTTNVILTVPDLQRTMVSWRIEERKLEERRLIEESDKELVRELFEDSSTVKLNTTDPITITPITSPKSSEMEEKNAKKTPEDKEKEKNKKPPELGSANDFMLSQAVAFINGQPVQRSSSKLE